MGFSPSLVDKVIEEKGKMNNFVCKFIEREKSIHVMKNNPWLFPDDHSLQNCNPGQDNVDLLLETLIEYNVSNQIHFGACLCLQASIMREC